MGNSIRPAVPEPLLRRVVEVWHPEEVRVFGSRARGEEVREDSDWDLCVIVPDDTPRGLLDPVAVRRAIRDLGLPVDLIPVTRGEFDEGRQHFDTLAEIVDREGVVVYAA